ncbi:DUF4465 domain-containing protein [Bacteroidales bacterium OttesenSCG-928-M11]|nr:DUF4465 domain-containing protein [Bacteroidales bacterium OttesenSCG-928-M11]
MKQRLYLLLVVVFCINNLNSAMAQGKPSPATFEDLELQPESFWFYNPENPAGSFKSGSFTFNNGWSEYNGFVYWDAFAYSNLTIGISDLNNPDYQFGAVTGKGVDNSSTFGVCFYSDYNIPIIDLDEAATVTGLYLTNSLYTYSSITKGDSYSGGPFETGDYLKVIFMPYSEEGIDKTKTVEFYLADYRSANSAEHYIVTDWTWLDLTALGSVNSITFTFEGSRNNEWGLLTPAYLCLDNLGSVGPVSGIVTPDMAISSIQYTNGVVRIQTSLDNYDVNIYSAAGTLLRKENLSGDGEINISSWAKGIYIVEVISSGKRDIKKIAK